MSYAVKEIFLTLQGEGGQAGRPAVFCRFAGCNLWSGREADRAEAVCTFCDTDFVGLDGPGGGRFATAEALADAVEAAWRGGADNRLVVLTGGEPLLQLDEPLIAALHARAFSLALETNGTIAAPGGVDWICVSPKADAALAQTQGQELKLVYPQEGVDPARFEGLAFERFLLQPMDGPALAENTRAAIAYCLAHPRWRLSVQTHKYLGIA
ncbi:7-carboxy-7-deazaguanine synthase [Phenylobacterium sp.]|jgi:7-carboxy-7-deazaguanine synthase (Cx14CxxC type)|uniref:7-carboxy-7-deazaguanine synthase n=1 Tax=Phenylobacterium sp. TaxID=1871053 RepID=UPI002E355331|nr:7-carboxy-7-deazaguanine synthase [Phenylobacterium sp.]HEX4711053.1 7-carboxy-7-deazaguanine synthase [Phenylobacterium sp.]